MKIKIKNTSHRYDINRPRLRHGHKGRRYKKRLSMMMLICIKQHISNIWSSIYQKVKQHWGWVKKSVANKKECISFLFLSYNTLYFNSWNTVFKL